MTDRELDQLMMRVLLDGLKEEEQQAEEPQSAFVPSAGYRRQMKKMCRDPLGWKRSKERSLWKGILHRAAMILLVLTVGFGTVMLTMPTVRAAVLKWVVEVYETYVLYRYSGESPYEEVPAYTITDLPEGFVETERAELGLIVDVVYENQEGDQIALTYRAVKDGGITWFDTDTSEISEITINGYQGQFYKTTLLDGSNTLEWIDPTLYLHFIVDGQFEKEEMLHMAESVSLVETTN